MLFNSLQYLVFLPVAAIGYFLLPLRARWVWLLTLSCLFYMAFVPIYVLIMAFTIIVDYIAGLLIERSTGARRRLLLTASIVANVGVLAVFKYFDFLAGNVAVLFQLADWTIEAPTLGMILPIGLSFHTFQAMSYTIEVYRGNLRAERHFGIYALYVMFFPQLVAGPIERPQNLLWQFRIKHTFDYERVTNGIRRIAWGMFKKIAIADRLAAYVNQVYDSPTENAGFSLLIATVFFAFQIYCDFSGYSDIAIGSAQVLGYRLMENFRHPYFAASVSEFWSRWHISLSTWFRDYVYIPLGGKLRRARNVMIVFMLSGLWHGASWTYVVWGGLNGLYVISEPRVPAPRWRPLRVVFTFALMCVTWIFFRAQTLRDALFILTHLVGDVPRALETLAIFGRTECVVAAGVVLVLLLIDWVEERRGGDIATVVGGAPLWIRWPAYYATGIATLLFGKFYGQQAFIYFQF